MIPALYLLISLSGITCMTGIAWKLSEPEKVQRSTQVIRINIPRPPVFIDPVIRRG